MSEATKRVQTNLKLRVDRAAALDIAAGVEHRDKAAIVEEALELREELMGKDYRDLIRAALAVRFSSDPSERLAAIEKLREDPPGAAPGGSASVSAAVAKLRAHAE